MASPKGKEVIVPTLRGKTTTAIEYYYNNDEGLTTPETTFEVTPEVVEGLAKASSDIIFFAENFFYIIDRAKKSKIKLRKYQREFLTTMVENNRVILLTARQIGKTTLMTIYALWLALFNDTQEIYILANKKETATMILERIAFAFREFPSWLKPGVREFNKSMLHFANGSKIKTSATTANSIRGNSVSCLILDEFAFVDEAKAEPFMTSVTPTLSSNPDAKFFISSTPNGIANQFYKLVYQAREKKSDFKLKTVTWRDVPGRTKEWKRRTIETDCGGDTDKFEQEYECKFMGASKSPFRPKTFERLKNMITEPIRGVYDGELCIYKEPENNRVYVIGVDVGEGIGQDFSVIQVLDITDLSKIEQVAMYASNFVHIRDFGNIILKVAKMYGNPVMAVERNGCGMELCNRLYEDEHYPHFVNYGTSMNKGKYSQNFKPGVISFQNTKTPAVVNMKYYLQDVESLIIHDKRFLAELEHFIKTQNNSWKAEDGYHDDVVMSLVWALYPLHKALVDSYFFVQGWVDNRWPKKVTNRFSYYIDRNKEDAEREGKRLAASSLPAEMTGWYGIIGMNGDKMYEDEEINPFINPRSNLKTQRDKRDEMEEMFRNFHVNGDGWNPVTIFFG